MGQEVTSFGEWLLTSVNVKSFICFTGMDFPYLLAQVLWAVPGVGVVGLINPSENSDSSHTSCRLDFLFDGLQDKKTLKKVVGSPK